MRKTLRILLGRVGFCGMLIALQALILIVVIWRFQEYFVYFYAFCVLLSVVVVMGILNNRFKSSLQNCLDYSNYAGSDFWGIILYSL